MPSRSILVVSWSSRSRPAKRGAAAEAHVDDLDVERVVLEGIVLAAVPGDRNARKHRD